MLLQKRRPKTASTVLMTLWGLLLFPIPPLWVSGHERYASVFATCFVLMPSLGLGALFVYFGNWRGRWLGMIISISGLSLTVWGLTVVWTR